MTRSDDAPASDLLARLEAGEPPARVRQTLNLGPSEFLLALGHAALGSDNPGNWPGLTQAAPRRPWLAPVLGEESLADAFPRSSRPARLAMAAGLLQVHDFWDASHEAAQQADDLGEPRFSAYWHAIAHRREPDPGNAAYWFRRVGRHPLFTRLAEDAGPIAEAVVPPLSGPPNITPVWDPFSFIDFCMRARAQSEVNLALRLQRLEMLALLEATLKGL